MLAKINRLTKDKEYDYAFKKGRGSYNKIIGMKAVQNNLMVNRFGVMVSLKVSKKAVERNRVKRIIREGLRKEMPKLKKGYDIVIISQPEILSRTSVEINNALETNFKRLRLYQ